MSLTTLISCAQLAAHLDDPQWHVFDCRFDLMAPEAGRRVYAESHIPGALYAHLDEDLSSPITATTGRHPLPDPTLLAEKLGQWGVDRDSQVVVYDGGGAMMAARMWWLLRWLGHDRVAVLDGGLARWQAEGWPMTPVVPEPAPARFDARLDDRLWVDTDFVDTIRKDPDWCLIDVRTPERFRGEQEPIDPVAGHIPGAINIPLSENLDGLGCFRPADELKVLYQSHLGDIAPDHVVVMCGSGVTACHTLLAMEHAGLTGAKLYAGSWSEWIRDPARPVATV